MKLCAAPLPWVGYIICATDHLDLVHPSPQIDNNLLWYHPRPPAMHYLLITTRFFTTIREIAQQHIDWGWKDTIYWKRILFCPGGVMTGEEVRNLVLIFNVWPEVRVSGTCNGKQDHVWIPVHDHQYRGDIIEFTTSFTLSTHHII
jgi:hypothetical protein